ncbi:heterodisulfide reductase subunit B [Desulfofundulus thermobenzoicus]|uniref:Heterodisulfide reductase subunit B n=1 Tax=Desulfofundulus thermobenzoicus TaxID=29376 RepID=A0A6N7ILR5_9FIRM|nr:CoB--CoM heterodisulfide reductase iron-sulfur subunit B family protein [Desulfofundulus thermobenzoicus]MQL50864.1 heterodisulfide reductase subunit B [Desulfofundulus thermobenzoicus]HHW42354.1 heterodisulfide reductase subunit B [Desulfotomaculum sp.]
MLSFSYFPGCSLEATAREFDLSTRAVCGELEVELVELPDWNCCGATSAHSLNGRLGLLLPARNLALAGEMDRDLVASCSACYNRLKTTDYALKNNPEEARRAAEHTGSGFRGNLRVLSLLEAVVAGVGVDRVRERVRRPLKRLKVVCYYGCLLVRPPRMVGFDAPEFPVSLDRLMAALGAEPLQWSYKTDCCGASLSICDAKTVRRMVSFLLEMAREIGAAAIVTACTLCHANLEMRRDPECTMPVFYFTELMGLAFGVPESEAWLKRHLVDPFPVLGQVLG